MPQSLAQWLAYLENLQPDRINLGLERVATVAGNLGLLTPKCLTITVAGTNGKGSTATLLATICRAAGYLVGLYTSPHIQHFNERVHVNGSPASAEDLCAAFAAVQAAQNGVALSYFEFSTLAALYLFRQCGVDVQVLEVGLGGRLDAVNVIDADAAIVTQIGLDHQDWLGDTRDAIGAEKAGVFRANHIAICADPDPPQGLLDAANRISAQLFCAHRKDYSGSYAAKTWSFHSAKKAWQDLPYPRLIGAHQLRNAAGALMVLAQLSDRLPVTHAAIASGLQQLHLPGRLQKMGRYCLDVAHNTEAAQAVYQALVTQSREWQWVIGVMADKPLAAMAAELAPIISHAHTIPLPSARAMSAEAIAAALQAAGIAATAHRDIESALVAAAASTNGPILISGSFLTVAAALPHISYD